MKLSVVVPTYNRARLLRRLLLQSVQTVQAGGSPPAVDTSYYDLRAIERIVPDGEEWRDSVLPLMYPAAEENLDIIPADRVLAPV